MEWKTLEKFPGYEISEFWDIRNLKTGNIRKVFLKNGYKFTKFTVKKNVKKNAYIHVLVAEAFLQKPKGYRKNWVVKHLDEDKLNCHFSNLQYWTQASNLQEHHAHKRRNLEGFLLLILSINFSSCLMSD